MFLEGELSETLRISAFAPSPQREAGGGRPQGGT